MRRGAGSEEFARQAEPFRRELLAHCYRMLGSVHDAEDLVQETMLRAWRSYAGYDPGQASMRTWLYRIATNACLNALDSRSRRPLPSDLTGPSGDTGRLPSGHRPEIGWLQPFPGPPGGPPDPAVVAEERDTIRLAFVAALQHLPARQRAVLILRDVLAWPAAEVASLLGITTPAVNSALQRARAQMRETAPRRGRGLLPHREREMAARYAAAFAGADIATLTRLLADEVVLEMPPYLTWFRGRDAVTRFLAARALAAADRWRVILAEANGQPAFGAYLREDDGRHRAHSVQVVTAAEAGITWIAAFQDPALFTAFGLPPVYPDSPGPGPGGSGLPRSQSVRTGAGCVQ